MKKIIIITILVLIVVSVVAVVLQRGRSDGSRATVDVEEIKRIDIESIVTAFGQAKPKVEVEISAKITGEIKELHVEEGDSVERGDTLLKIDPGIYRTKVDQSTAQLRSSEANLRQQVANLRKLEIDLQRTRQMFDKGLVSQNELEQMETRYEVQKAVVNSSENSIEQSKSYLQQALEELSYTTIRSPQNGIVIGLSREVGEYVIVGTLNNPGSVIMTIAQLDSMEVLVNVDETDVVNLRVGQDVKITFDAISDTIFSGVVRRIGNKAIITMAGRDETIANFPVEITIVDVPEQIRSGMSVTAEIITQKSDSALAVPIQSIISGLTRAEMDRGVELDNDKTEFVFIHDNGIAKKIPVTTGIADASHIEIIDGVDEGQEVIIGPYNEIRMLYDGKPIQKSAGQRFDETRTRTVSVRFGSGS